MEDFRKLSILLAKSIKHIEVKDFFSEVIDKFGVVKVKEFMEIQLINSQEDYNKFI